MAILLCFPVHVDGLRLADVPQRTKDATTFFIDTVSVPFTKSLIKHSGYVSFEIEMGYSTLFSCLHNGN